MTHLERLKLELFHKSYFIDDEYSIFIDENGLAATEHYNKTFTVRKLLQTVIAFLQALTNNRVLSFKCCR